MTQTEFSPGFGFIGAKCFIENNESICEKKHCFIWGIMAGVKLSACSRKNSFPYHFIHTFPFSGENIGLSWFWFMSFQHQGFIIYNVTIQRFALMVQTDVTLIRYRFFSKTCSLKKVPSDLLQLRVVKVEFFLWKFRA